jgi:hypothetical protein
MVGEFIVCIDVVGADYASGARMAAVDAVLLSVTATRLRP